jgi:hypothetical protein
MKMSNVIGTKAAELDDGLDTEIELTEDEQPQVKQKALSGRPIPLRRTG